MEFHFTSDNGRNLQAYLFGR